MSDLDLLREVGQLVHQPSFDELVETRRRRTLRTRVATASALTVAAVAVVGATLATTNQGANTVPSPVGPSPSKATDPTPVARPLVYAAGKIVHWGDRTFEADTTVAFIDATDDGVVFLTQKHYREHRSETLWFYDGSTTEAIGRVPIGHIGEFDIQTANPGSLVVWADATSQNQRFGPTRFIAYDTSRHEVVGSYKSVLDFDERHIFFAPDSGSKVMRYDVVSRETLRVSRNSFKDELRAHERRLMSTFGARFTQVGRRLVPVDSNGDPTTIRLTTGEPLKLRVPAGYTAPGDEMPVVQLLDDERLVLFAYSQSHWSDTGLEFGDLLTCQVPDRVCTVSVRASSTRYAVPG